MGAFSTKEILSALDELAPEYGVDPSTAKSIIIAENTKDGKLSRYKTFSGDATNQNQTMGLGQVIPSTARGLQQAGFLASDWKFDPDDLHSQLKASLAAMKEMQGRQSNPGDPFELGAMYNGGTNAWNAYRAGKQMNPETTQYLQKMRTGMAELNMTPQQIEALSASGLQNEKGAAGSGTPGMRRSTSSSTSTTGYSYDAAAMDRFNQATGMMQNPGGLFDQGMAALDARTSGVQEAGGNVIASIMQAGQAAGASASADAMLLAGNAERRAALLSRANMNPDQTNNRADQALRALDETSARLDQLRPEIDSRTSVGFFDNPLEYLVNQTRLPGMIGQYNNMVQVQQDALGKYHAAKDIAQSTLSMSESIDADSILASGAAKANAVAAESKSKADQVNLLLQQKNAADALQKVSMGLQMTDLTLKQLMLDKQSESVKQGESESEARTKGEQAALSEFNAMVIAAGGKGIAYDRFKQLTPKAKEEILSSNSTGRFGGDFVSALKFVEKYGNINNMAQGGQMAVRTWVNDTDKTANDMVIAAQTAAEHGGTGKTFNPAKAKENAFNTLAAKYEAASNVNMRDEPATNPFKIDYKSILQLPNYKDNIWAQQMARFGPNGTEKQFGTYDEQAFMKKAVTTARLSPNPGLAVKQLTQDITTFYKSAARQQQEQTKPQLFGLATPAKTYPISFPDYQVGNKMTTTDMGDPVQVENLLTKQVAKEMAESNPFSLQGARASNKSFFLN